MRRVQVVACAKEAREVMSLVLEPTDGVPLPAFEAGAHIDVEIAPGLVRPYSLCPPLDQPRCYRIAIRRDPQGRGGSVSAHARLRVGSEVRIGAPRNLFALADGAPHSVLFAGGIGITPLLAMAGELQRRGATFHLHYSAKSAWQAAFADELAHAFGGRAHFHFGDRGGRLDIASVLADVPAHAHLYVCGPARYTEAVVQVAGAAGWPVDAVHRESFAPPLQEVRDGDRDFVVRTARTGRTVRVARDQSLLAALLAAGFDIPTSCEQGVCGTCLTRVLAGVPDHRDTYLTEGERAANTHVLPCCSRARSPELVLDL